MPAPTTTTPAPIVTFCHNLIAIVPLLDRQSQVDGQAERPPPGKALDIRKLSVSSYLYARQGRNVSLARPVRSSPDRKDLPLARQAGYQGHRTRLSGLALRTIA